MEATIYRRPSLLPLWARFGYRMYNECILLVFTNERKHIVDICRFFNVNFLHIGGKKNPIDNTCTNCRYNYSERCDVKIRCKRTRSRIFSYKLRYIVGFRLVKKAISTKPKPLIYRNLYENTRPDTWRYRSQSWVLTGLSVWTAMQCRQIAVTVPLKIKQLPLFVYMYEECV